MPIAIKKVDTQDKFVKQVEKIYGNFNVALKVGKEEIIIIHRCRVKQDDNIELTHFIIFIQLVSEETLKYMKIYKVHSLSIKCNRNNTGAPNLH